jgi:signal transduction histidine kinase
VVALIGRYGSDLVSVSAPAQPVELPGRVAAEISAAVGAALSNVERHCGVLARAWILLEDEPDAVVVTVRDDGPGMVAGTLERAQSAGRLGVAQSIRGRILDLGGTVTITSTAGEGTEVELRVPRGPVPRHRGQRPDGIQVSHRWFRGGTKQHRARLVDDRLRVSTDGPGETRQDYGAQ